MLYPLPAVLVTSRSASGEDDVCTVAWAGTVCTSPAMVSISLKPSRLSYQYIRETGVFGINLTTEELAYATDYCGVRSGRDTDKFADARLTKEEAGHISCTLIAESPVQLECRVAKELELGSHTMFVAEILAVHADEAYLDAEGRFDLNRSKPLVYSHGAYLGLGTLLGTFGWSVRKKKRKKSKIVHDLFRKAGRPAFSYEFPSKK